MPAIAEVAGESRHMLWRDSVAPGGLAQLTKRTGGRRAPFFLPLRFLSSPPEQTGSHGVSPSKSPHSFGVFEWKSGGNCSLKVTPPFAPVSFSRFSCFGRI
jgi:hypothetical protein